MKVAAETPLALTSIIVVSPVENSSQMPFRVIEKPNLQTTPADEIEIPAEFDILTPLQRSLLQRLRSTSREQMLSRSELAEALRINPKEDLVSLKFETVPNTVSQINEAPTGSRPRYLLPLLRREQNPSEAETSSHSSPDLRPRFSAKGDRALNPSGRRIQTVREKDDIYYHYSSPEKPDEKQPEGVKEEEAPAVQEVAAPQIPLQDGHPTLVIKKTHFFDTPKKTPELHPLRRDKAEQVAGKRAETKNFPQLKHDLMMAVSLLFAQDIITRGLTRGDEPTKASPSRMDILQFISSLREEQINTMRKIAPSGERKDLKLVILALIEDGFREAWLWEARDEQQKQLASFVPQLIKRDIFFEDIRGIADNYLLPQNKIVYRD